MTTATQPRLKARYNNTIKQQLAKDLGINNEMHIPKLEKIVPHAHVVSAKVCDFDASMEHVSYDFDACVRLCEKLGFKGTYMVAQYSAKFQDIDYAKVADWVIAHLKQNINA